MTNLQCYSYAAQAISNLKEQRKKLRPDTLYKELACLWDMYGEEEIEQIVRKKENSNELF